MAYENISFNLPHMAVREGYFYLLDQTKEILAVKQSNGEVGFQFPLDIPSGFTDYTVGNVKCLQYDGYSFWSLQDFTAGDGVLLRQWQVDNFTCKLVNQFPKITNASTTYSCSTFSVEYYNTTLTSNAYDGDVIITIDEYTDSVIYNGTVIGLGPSKYGPRETVTVSGVTGNNIVLTEPLKYNFFSGDAITITPSLLMFNNYYLKDADQGALIMLDPYTGNDISVTGDIEYDNIKASKFTRLNGVLQDYTDIYTLAYVKDTNLKLRDMSDLYRYKASLKGSDDFTGPDDSLPNAELWDVVTGNPKIQDNTLFFSTVGVGHDSVEAKYNLISDFDFTISGSLGDVTTFSGGQTTLDQYVELSFVDAAYTYGLKYLEYTPISTKDNLILELLMDGNAEDTSGYDHHGILYNNPISTEGINGLADTAYKFTGSNYIRVNNTSTLEVGKNNADFSLVFWVKVLTNYTGSWRGLTSKSTNTGARRTFALWLYPTSLRVHCRISTTANYNEGTDSSELPLGEWVQFAYVKKGNQLIIYLDAVYDAMDSSMADVVSSSDSIYIGDSTEYGGVGAAIDKYRLFDKALTVEELEELRQYDLDNNPNLGTPDTYIVQSKNGNVESQTLLCSGISPQWFNFRLYREDTTLGFDYQTVTASGVASEWYELNTVDISTNECLLSLGMRSTLATVSGAYFDSLVYNDGYLRFPSGDSPYYGIMGMDNIQNNQSTIIPIYAIDIEDDNLYRLQNKACYYGEDVTWSDYHYQVSPIRPFVDFITVDSDTHILPATGRNVTPVRSVTLDQYGQGVVNRPITFTDDDDVGFITTEVVHTDYFYDTGRADTAYTSGLELRVVEIIASATQLD